MNSSVKNFMKDYLSTKLVPGKSSPVEEDACSPIGAAPAPLRYALRTFRFACACQRMPIKQIIGPKRPQYIRPSQHRPCLKSSYRAESLSHRHFNTWGQYVAHARDFLISLTGSRVARNSLFYIRN